MTDTCDNCSRCAAVWRAAMERAARLLELDCPTYALERKPACGECAHCVAAGRTRALADSPPPCSCKARDAVVEAAAAWADPGPDGEEEAIELLADAVAALEGDDR